jgi:aminoglycoside/choline kinase family phosphotransferase
VGSRLDQINVFLESNQIKQKKIKAINSDASFRRYFRVAGKILMDANPTVVDDLDAFINIDNLLINLRLNAPKIYSIDKENGFLLLEDLGDNLFSKVLNANNEESLYKKAIDILVYLHNMNINQFSKNNLVQNYSDEKLISESELFIEWYIKSHLNININENQINEFKEIFSKIIASLKLKYDTLVLRDFHVDNLVLQHSKSGLGQVGLLDFQDAVFGQSSYDLISLIEDVRRPISSKLKISLIKYFIDATGYDPVQLDNEMAFFSVQRNLKILGIFCRLSIRDQKSQYMKFNDNAWQFINFNLKNPIMIDIYKWLKLNLPNE